MSDSTHQGSPDIWPHVERLQSGHRFAYEGDIEFGWDDDDFRITRWGAFGDKVLQVSPLSEEGWERAWETMVSRFPGLASAVTARVAREHRAALGIPNPGATPVLIVTTNEVPGFRIERVHGEVFGLTVRARNMFSNWGANLRTVVGGEVVGYTKLLAASRHEATERLRDEVRRLGGNAVVAMRFDCNEIGDIMSEIVAYGTAVTLVPGEAPAEPSEAEVLATVGQ